MENALHASCFETSHQQMQEWKGKKNSLDTKWHRIDSCCDNYLTILFGLHEQEMVTNRFCLSDLQAHEFKKMLLKLNSQPQFIQLLFYRCNLYC